MRRHARGGNEENVGSGPSAARHRLFPGLEAYRNGLFEKALRIFEEILSAYPEDGPSKLFARRCRLYLESPPPAWDGVFVATTK